MTKIRVTKIFNWEMSHALYNHNGLCRNLHGHSYKMHATVFGSLIKGKKNPKWGMVIDFGDFKKIVKKEIVDEFDHSVVLCSKEDIKSITGLKSLFDRIHVVEFQPTCENLVTDFAHRIIKKLPEGVTLYSLRLYETATSYAEWFAGDQK
ncbi:MAG: 6-carboxytetrahydropterin synthase [Candidatus Delongbacteria bacterium]|jgi:6-pyruvoyltetrahydropterin/6-carboxytetrahydropterin synthase|nr:6-carboxytetrahydropterin synthase [Candidatus Delongbacteria bacterium]